MKRKKVKNKYSQKLFTSTAIKTKKINKKPRPMRGGTRL
jgi:hypothetical protein